MNIKIKKFGLTNYLDIHKLMVQYTNLRNKSTPDELWLLEHSEVFTQGRHHNKNDHLLNSKINIPIVQSDRGGNITYHGPGQAIIYFLLDLKRFKIGIKNLISIIEQACIKMLKTYNIEGNTLKNSPGVYIKSKKIASLGLRIRNKKSYHGIAINTNMDLTPFNYINPCGYKNLKMTQISDFKKNLETSQVLEDYVKFFCTLLNIKHQ